MALSRTLIRTYAIEHEAQPALALGAANRRILMDARAKLFVTVFYCILDAVSGTLTYCNAGHNPPYLLSAKGDRAVQALGTTGIPLGIFEDWMWEQETAQLVPGDVLVLYSDGITEAQNAQEVLFGTGRLLKVLQAKLERPAQDVQDAVLEEVHGFVGDAPQFDDMTLMVVVRKDASRRETLTKDIS
jgi:serine phosphatase RsbU (regulator of sigma subunit)